MTKLKYLPGHSGKPAFRSRQEAEHAERKNHFGKKQHVYKCNAEGILHFHLSGQSKVQSRVAQAERRRGFKTFRRF